jgi:2-dehydropantoate 2-reductase
MKWSKLLTNLVANATCAILDEEPSAVYADRRLAAVERAMVLEALAAMAALGLPVLRLPGADVRLLAFGYKAPAELARPFLRRVIGGARGGKLPSLALHVRAEAGPTEGPWMYGAVAAAARAKGVPAPVNETLARLLEEVALDPVRRAALRGNRTAFLAAIGHATITRRDP